MDNVVQSECNSKGDGDKVQVQHVTKKSSDELLRKFAEVGGGDEGKKVTKRRKRGGGIRRREGDVHESGSAIGSSALVERRSLLPGVTKKSVLLVKLGRSDFRRARDLRSKSFLAGIQKTWRMTVEGASRVLLEKHYNRHRRLINDVV